MIEFRIVLHDLPDDRNTLVENFTPGLCWMSGPYRGAQRAVLQWRPYVDPVFHPNTQANWIDIPIVAAKDVGLAIVYPPPKPPSKKGLRAWFGDWLDS